MQEVLRLNLLFQEKIIAVEVSHDSRKLRYGCDLRIHENGDSSRCTSDGTIASIAVSQEIMLKMELS